MLSNNLRVWLLSLQPGDRVVLGIYRSYPVLASTEDSLTVDRSAINCPPATYRKPHMLQRFRADTDTHNRLFGSTYGPAGASPEHPFQLPTPLPADHDPVTACVYRLYAKDGTLLYVGSAYDPYKRLTEHRKLQQWWPRVSRATYEWHPNRMLADLAEHTAIVYESPEMNYSGAHPHYKYRRSPSVRT